MLNTAAAQEAPAAGGYQFFDLLSHLDGAPFMGSFEARYGSLGFLSDAIHLQVSTKITTHEIFFQGANTELKADTGTGIALYRVLVLDWSFEGLLQVSGVPLRAALAQLRR